MKQGRFLPSLLMFNFVKTLVLSWLLQLWASIWLLAAVPIKILKKKKKSFLLRFIACSKLTELNSSSLVSADKFERSHFILSLSPRQKLHFSSVVGFSARKIHVPPLLSVQLSLFIFATQSHRTTHTKNSKGSLPTTALDMSSGRISLTLKTETGAQTGMG